MDGVEPFVEIIATRALAQPAYEERYPGDGVKQLSLNVSVYRDATIANGIPPGEDTVSSGARQERSQREMPAQVVVRNIFSRPEEDLAKEQQWLEDDQQDGEAVLKAFACRQRHLCFPGRQGAC